MAGMAFQQTNLEIFGTEWVLDDGGEGGRCRTGGLVDRETELKTRSRIVSRAHIHEAKSP